MTCVVKNSSHSHHFPSAPVSLPFTCHLESSETPEKGHATPPLGGAVVTPQGHTLSRARRPEEPGLCEGKVTDLAESPHHLGGPRVMSVTLEEPDTRECQQEDGRHGGQDRV